MRKCGALLQDFEQFFARPDFPLENQSTPVVKSVPSLYRDGRTVFEKINDTTIYIPELQMEIV